MNNKKDQTEIIPNILAQRYASCPIQSIWKPTYKIFLERKLWVSVLKEQQLLGINIPIEAIEAYEAVMGIIDMQAIQEEEVKTKHDVKARINVFCKLAGFEHIHKGLTSRDITETVEQIQIHASLGIVIGKAILVLEHVSQVIKKYEKLVLTARTHNVPAQMTTLGRRFCMFAESFLLAIKKIDSFYKNYPFRGIKGAIGTQNDLLALFKKDVQKLEAFEKAVLKNFGIDNTYSTPGQIYPRVLDFEVVSHFVGLMSALCNFATNVRLMAGHQLIEERLVGEQTGSSAMPHKVNCRYSERMSGFGAIMQGYLQMTSSLAFSQWNEGDVACSVVRRVVFPDSFFAMDGALETMLYILKKLCVNEETIFLENQKYLPFLLTSQFLMEAVSNGVGRETAHAIIKKHCQKAKDGKELLELLYKDKVLNLKPENKDDYFANPSLGLAQKQQEDLLKKIDCEISSLRKTYTEYSSMPREDWV